MHRFAVRPEPGHRSSRPRRGWSEHPRPAGGWPCCLSGGRSDAVGLPIALQFVTFSSDQRPLLKKAATLPRHVETMMDAFEHQLTPEQQADPRFAFRVFMVHKTANRAPGVDLAVELVPPGSDIAEKFDLGLKEVKKRKYLPNEIVAIMKAEGWDRFTMDSHTQLWKRLDARNPAKGYGAVAVGMLWSWYETWLTRVCEECQQHPNRYCTLPVSHPAAPATEAVSAPSATLP